MNKIRKVPSPDALERGVSLASNSGRVARADTVGDESLHDAGEDNPEWTEADFARARPASEMHGSEIVRALVRKRGRPPMAAADRKEKVTLRLSPEVLAHFRATGDGWQTRIDDALTRVAKKAVSDSENGARNGKA